MGTLNHGGTTENAGSAGGARGSLEAVPAGFEPASFRSGVGRVNLCATALPSLSVSRGGGYSAGAKRSRAGM